MTRRPQATTPSAETLLAAFEAQGRRCAGPAHQTLWAATALARQTAELLDIAERLTAVDTTAGRDYRNRRRLIETVLAEAVEQQNRPGDACAAPRRLL